SAIEEHISISLLSFFIALLIGVPAGFICVRYVRSEKIILPFFQALRVIPSLAILLLLIPVIGTGVKPAVIALIILAVPPILINTAAGLRDVPDFMITTATGCGMTSKQTWLKVRFPLAMPMISAGCKTAIVEIIASATLAAKIGAGGLGTIIFTGLGLSRFDLLFIGGITVAILSLSAALLIELIDRITMKYKYVN
ncbi:MAG: ABC transporter permease, partial [Defluviitaleaceae bacterium]|nr:ABC transporter permease [Defluviitaleaceae bacterium]